MALKSTAQRAIRASDNITREGERERERGESVCEHSIKVANIKWVWQKSVCVCVSVCV